MLSVSVPLFSVCLTAAAVPILLFNIENVELELAFCVMSRILDGDMPMPSLARLFSAAPVQVEPSGLVTVPVNAGLTIVAVETVTPVKDVMSVLAPLCAKLLLAQVSRLLKLPITCVASATVPLVRLFGFGEQFAASVGCTSHRIALTATAEWTANFLQTRPEGH